MKSFFTIYTLLALLLATGKWVSGQNGGQVSNIVTDSFFNGIANQAAAGCAGKGFYTRSAFLQSTQPYPKFGNTGSSDDAKREIAAFFAHVTHETGHLCYTREINGQSRNYCDTTQDAIGLAPFGSPPATQFDAGPAYPKPKRNT